MKFYELGESPLLGFSEKCIAPLVLGGIIAAGASLASNAIGAASQSDTNDTSKEIAEMNNKFNAEEAAKNRAFNKEMWDLNNQYNSPEAMMARGINPFVGQNVGAGISKSPAASGSAASSAGLPSLQAFRPDFSDIGRSLASMAQARAAMLDTDRQQEMFPALMSKMLGDTNWRNIGVGQSGYWNSSTGRKSALLDQSKEYQELRNMEFSGRLVSAQEAQILLDSEAQQVLNKYLDEQQQADLFIKGQTLANLYAQGSLSEAQYKREMAQAVKLSAETNGIRINNRIAQETADSLIYANVHANRARGLSSLWDSKNTNVLKNIEYSKEKALRDYYKWSSKHRAKDVNSYELRNAIDYGSKIFQGVGNIIGTRSGAVKH